MRRTAADAAATRARIAAVARARFAEHGFAHTSLDAIAAAAGCTRGAVHHHFGDKRRLFVEIFEALEQELNDAVVAAAVDALRRGEDRLAAGCRALFAFVRRDDYRRIALADGAGVLGLLEWYRIDREAGLRTMRGVVQVLADAGRIEQHQVDPIALVLFGGLTEAALTFAVDGEGITEDDVIETVQRMLDGLGSG